MKKTILLVFIIAFVSGCVSSERSSKPTLISIPSDWSFYSKGSACLMKPDFWKKYDSLFKERSDMLKYFVDNYNVSVEEVEQALNDPFITSNMNYISFETLLSAKNISNEITNLLLKRGWHIGRNGLFLEDTNGNGDWIRVFSKNSARLHVHVVGPWDSTGGDLIVRTVIFKFLNCTPEKIFRFKDD
ncbi:MAG: hypothetical protein PHY48_12310 [Candidatus Cloacimonetes bacterium]|nr:hypothetical protein [Candidatus Cloacimonadota bacterium]